MKESTPPRGHLACCLVLLAFTGCSTTSQVVANAVDYSKATATEEAASRFQKLTEDADNVVGPVVLYPFDGTNYSITYDVRNRIALSPDGRELAFIGEQNGNRNIFLKEVKGGGAKIQRTFRSRVIDPAFSPDGKWLAYAENRNGSFNIYLVDPKGGAAVRQVTTDEGWNSYPFFSSDSRQIFYVQNERKSVVLQTADSVFRKSYTTGSLWSRSLETGMLTQYGEATTPSLAPDGRIAVVRYNAQAKISELWLLDLVRSSETIIHSGNAIRDPAVSPDGSKVAFVGYSKESGKPGNFDIFTVGIDGTNLTQLTFHEVNDVCPRWAPDGKSIYFLSQRQSPKGKWNVWNVGVTDPASQPVQMFPAKDVSPKAPDLATAPAVSPVLPKAPAVAAPVLPAPTKTPSDPDPYAAFQKSGAPVNLVLKSGTELGGVITEVTAETLRIKSGEATLSIKRADIRELQLK